MNSRIQNLLPMSLLAWATLFNPTVQAAENGFYLGASVVRSHIGTNVNAIAISNNASSINLSDSDNGFKVIAGLRPRDWLAIEANYIDFGKVGAQTAEYGLKGLDAFALFFISAPSVDLYAKVGGMYWQGDGSADMPFCMPSRIGASSTCWTTRNSEKNSGFDLAYGTGVQARLRSVGVRLEYEQFRVDDAERVSAVSLSLLWMFE